MKRRLSKAISVVLIISVFLSIFVVNPLKAHGKEEYASFEIGENDRSVQAKLDGKGRLTISGAGNTKSYKPGESPLIEVSEEIIEVRIDGGITSIGAYLFYACSNISYIEISETVISIEEYAFWSDHMKALSVVNHFDSLQTVAQENGKYSAVTIYEQEISDTAFPPTSLGSYYSRGENKSFAAIMDKGGYIRGDSLVTAVFNSGEAKSLGDTEIRLPAVEGEIILPDVPTDFKMQENDLFIYNFAGWTELKDTPDTVTAAGERYSVGERDNLYFIASWDQATIGNITRVWKDDSVILTVSEIEGYDLKAFRWQLCEDGSGQWVDIKGETNQTYVRKIEQGDENKDFRCLVSVRKKGLLGILFTGPEQEIKIEVPSMANLLGLSSDVNIVTYNANGGQGFMQEQVVAAGEEKIVMLCEFTAAAQDKTFGGWSGSDGKQYHPGDALIPEGDLTLTAIWVTPVVEYASNASEFTDALSSFSGGSIYTNYIVITNDIAVPPAMPAVPVTITARAPDTGEEYPEARFKFAHGDWNIWDETGGTEGILGAETRFENITLFAVRDAATGGDIFGNGHRLTMGKNVRTVSLLDRGYSVTGANMNNPVQNADVRIFSGSYQNVSGVLSWWTGITGDANVTIAGGTINGAVYAAAGAASAIPGKTQVRVAGGVVNGEIYGGGNSARVFEESKVSISGGVVNGDIHGGGVDANVDGVSQVIISGGEITGNIYAGGKRGSAGTGKLLITDGVINGDVYGGGDYGNVIAGAQVYISGTSTIDGNVYLGGNSGVVSGSTQLKISEGQITGDVYGGGKYGNVGGTLIEMSGGIVGGNIYGGGSQGSVFGNTAVVFEGGVLLGNLFGAGKGGDSEIIVEGNTSVTVTGGKIGSYDDFGSLCENTGDVVGGGEYAIVEGDTHVTIDTGEDRVVGGNVYGGGYFAPVGNAVVDVSGFIGKNLYGGGFGLEEASCESTEVNIYSGEIAMDVHGAGAIGITNGTSTVNMEGGSVFGSLFGAGQGEIGEIGRQGMVKGDVSVNLSGGTVQGAVFGGGDYAVVGDGEVEVSGASMTVTASTAANINLSISGANIGMGVFGAGNGSGSGENIAGAVFGSVNIDISAGDIAASVFGGGNRAVVSGNTNIYIKAGEGDISIGRSVFGGGNLPSGTYPEFRDDLSLVFGTSHIEIEGGDILIGASVFGCGNLTGVSGTKTIDMINFTGELESIQRADTVNLVSSQVNMLGAADVTEGVTRYYSVAHVKNMRLANSSLLGLDREVNNLGNIGGYTRLGETFTANYDEEGRSTLSIGQGRSIHIRENDVYGEITGRLWLKITQTDSQELGISVRAGAANDIGDGSETGAFVKSPDMGDISLISGAKTNYCYWQMGNTASVVDFTLQVIHSESGGTGTENVLIELPWVSESGTELVVSGAQLLSGDLNLIMPDESSGEIRLPAMSAGQTADNTAALLINQRDVNDGRQASPGVYIMTELPQGDSSWNSSIDGVWRRDSGPLAVPDAQEKEIWASIFYDPDFGTFSGGVLQITFEEYNQGERDPENQVGTVTLNLTIEGSVPSTPIREVFADGGRRFSEITNQEEVRITGHSAISVMFATNYLPVVPGASSMAITLYKGTQEVQFPAGTSIVLSDITDLAHKKYYHRRVGAESSVILSTFAAMGAGTPAFFPGPTDNTQRIDERLVFAIDFSDVAVPLELGEYSVRLTHLRTETARQEAFFAIVEPLSYIGIQVIQQNQRHIGIRVDISPDEAETAFLSGSAVKFTLKSGGSSISFPRSVVASGEGMVSTANADGTITVKASQAGSGNIIFDFSAAQVLAQGIYELTADLAPAAGSQVYNDSVLAVSSQAVSFNLGAPGAQGEQSARGIRISMGSGMERILDVSEGPESRDITIAAVLEQGDIISYEIFRKTGSAPEQSSYTAVENSGGWCVVAQDGKSARLTVPKNTQDGTYRLVFRIEDSQGNAVLEEPFNFIVHNKR